MASIVGHGREALAAATAGSLLRRMTGSGSAIRTASAGPASWHVPTGPVA